jgi:hypothetical protein
VLPRFEIEDGQVAGAFAIGLSQRIRRVVDWLSLLEVERAIRVRCHVEQDIAEADVILVGTFGATEICPFDFHAEIWFEVYAAAFDAVTVGVEETVGWACGDVLEDGVASLAVGRFKTSGMFGLIDGRQE